MTNNISFVLVPGAWHPSSCFDPVASKLKAAGYEVKGLDLVSFGAEPPLDDFNPDVQVARKLIEEEADRGRDVIVFMHSYGGMVGTEACRGLDKQERNAMGKKGGVVELIYCCSFMMPEGVSLYDALNRTPLHWWIIYDNDKRVDVVRPEDIFYNDLTPDHAREAASILKHHSHQTMMSNLTYAAYKTIPVTYIYCTKDNALVIDGQKAMVQAVEQMGVKVKTFTLEASHSPFYSMPEELFQIYHEVAQAIL